MTKGQLKQLIKEVIYETDSPDNMKGLWAIVEKPIFGYKQGEKIKISRNNSANLNYYRGILYVGSQFHADAIPFQNLQFIRDGVTDVTDDMMAAVKRNKDKSDKDDEKDRNRLKNDKIAELKRWIKLVKSGAAQKQLDDLTGNV